MQYMRQPKLYIKLPSGGNYWPEGSLELPESSEIPVFSMTAKDELMFKTPDALLNGQGVVDVIQSCLPNIKDGWQTPTIDLDTILIAIRIATYGEKMEISHIVPNTSETMEHEIDLRYVMDQVNGNAKWIDQVEIGNNLLCYVKPLNYRHLTKTSLKAFEAQKIMQVVNNDEITDEQKIAMFGKSFDTMTTLTVDLVAESVYSIRTADGIVDDPAFIREFIENADRTVFEKIQKHINTMKDKNGIRPLEIQATEEQIELGAPETYEVPIGFDNSDFFAKGS